MNVIRNHGSRQGNGRRPKGALPLLRAFLIGAAMALAWGALSNLFHLNRLFPDTAAEQLFSRPLPVQIALYGFVSPLLEEILFRKLLFDFTRRIAGEKAAAVIVSALFAIWHWNVIQMLYAFPAGLILQALRQESGRMEEPVCCHIGANLTAVAVQAFL